MKLLFTKIMSKLSKEIYENQRLILKDFSRNNCENKAIESAFVCAYFDKLVKELETNQMEDFLDITFIRQINKKIFEILVKSNNHYLEPSYKIRAIIDDILLEHETEIKKNIQDNPSLKEALQNFYVISKLTS